MRFLSRSARFFAKSRHTAISRLFVRAIPSLRPRFVVSILALSGASRQLPQRGSHWRAGPLFAGCLRPDRAQKSGPRLRGQRLLNKSALSSCCESRPQGTTVSDKIKLCLSRVGLTGTPVPLPMGEVSPKVTERACRCQQNARKKRIFLEICLCRLQTGPKCGKMIHGYLMTTT